VIEASPNGKQTSMLSKSHCTVYSISTVVMIHLRTMADSSPESFYHELSLNIQQSSKFNVTENNIEPTL